MVTKKKTMAKEKLFLFAYNQLLGPLQHKKRLNHLLVYARSSTRSHTIQWLVLFSIKRNNCQSHPDPGVRWDWKSNFIIGRLSLFHIVNWWMSKKLYETPESHYQPIDGWIDDGLVRVIKLSRPRDTILPHKPLFWRTSSLLLFRGHCLFFALLEDIKFVNGALKPWLSTLCRAHTNYYYHYDLPSIRTHSFMTWVAQKKDWTTLNSHTWNGRVMEPLRLQTPQESKSQK